MIARDELAQYFEKEFAHFEANRMYPLGYRKEPAMLKLTQKHVDALVRTQSCHLQSYHPSANAMYRQQFDDDLLRLEELKNLVMRIIYDPEFTYGPADR